MSTKIYARDLKAGLVVNGRKVLRVGTDGNSRKVCQAVCLECGSVVTTNADQLNRRNCASCARERRRI